VLNRGLRRALDEHGMAVSAHHYGRAVSAVALAFFLVSLNVYVRPNSNSLTVFGLQRHYNS